MGALTRFASRIQRRYAHGERRPLGGYLVTLGTYGTVVGALALAGRLTGRRLPERVDTGDIVLLSVAAYKLSRTLSKDAVTSPLRAPFTSYQEPAGASELVEKVHGDGVRHAVGELLTCPFCLGVWCATGLSAGLVFAPRLTRMLSVTLTAAAASDFLQLAYATAKHEAQEG